ncbi:MAG TPA: amidohydrolase [Gemmatimonadales bacterium]|jgi:amidohydrolase|nr:amidohydrolase [Gemmatimonadales bacterium]
MRPILLLLVALGLPTRLDAQSSRLDAEIDRRAAQIAGKVLAWRRDIHQHPELSNRETRTAELVAQHLRSLGIEVHTGVAHTGVIGVLRGGRPGPVVALRADMDALPVTEEVDVPFASKVRTTYNGQEVGVMHACGHDTHVAMLMGVAEVLAGMRNELPGTVKFIFQPAEEGAPAGERGGAALMIEEGALDDPKPSAIFGLHVFPYPAGEIRYRPGGIMAAADAFRIVVRGRQTHGALPWAGIDPVVVAAQIVLGLQTITSRQIDLTAAPAVVTVGTINGGVRFNIIPDSVVMLGTIRTFDNAMRSDIHQRVRRTAESIAQSAGATAQVTIDTTSAVTFNDSALTQTILPTLREVAGASHVALATPTTTAEDFSRYQQRIPGVFFFLGITPPGTDPAKVAPNHSPRFYVDEAALPVGVRALAHLAVDYLSRGR